MTTWVLIVFLLLSCVEMYCIFRFIRDRKPFFLKSVLITYLSFAVYLLSMVNFSWAIPQYVLILVMAAIFVHTFLGCFMNLYERTKRFDRYMHAFGCFSYSLLVYCTIANIFGGSVHKLYASLFVFTIGLSLGVFTEIAEFLRDSRKNAAPKMQKGQKDTDMDLVFDTYGSLAAGLFVYFVML